MQGSAAIVQGVDIKRNEDRPTDGFSTANFLDTKPAIVGNDLWCLHTHATNQLAKDLASRDCCMRCHHLYLHGVAGMHS